MSEKDPMAMVKTAFKGGLAISAFILPIYLVIAIFRR